MWKNKKPSPPWRIKQIEKIIDLLKMRKSDNEIVDSFSEYLEQLSYDNLTNKDPESVEYAEYLKKENKDLLTLSSNKESEMIELLKKKNKFNLLWRAWGKIILDPKNKKSIEESFATYQELVPIVDAVVIYSFLRPLTSDELWNLYYSVRDEEWNFETLKTYCKKFFKYSPTALETYATLFESFVGINYTLFDEGKNFRARAQALRVMHENEKKTRQTKLHKTSEKELTPEFLEKIQNEISPIIEQHAEEKTQKIVKEQSQTLTDKIQVIEDKTADLEIDLKKLEERAAPLEERISELKDTERRSIQVIGIFAAIVALIVAVVPLAVRVKEESLFLTITGLAIVLGGLLLLAAILFGGEKRPKWKWITVPIILLFIWMFLVLNTHLVKINPKIDSISKDTSQVEKPIDKTNQ